MNTDTKPAIINHEPDEELDYLAMAKTLWKNRKTIITNTLIAGVLGIFLAYLMPKEYTSTTTIVPQTSSTSLKLGGLSSLAAMAGFNLDNLGNQNDALSPLVYPKIISSAPFLVDLMNSNFTTREADRPVTLYEYYTTINKPGILSYVKKYTIELPGVIISALKEEDKTTAGKLDPNGPIKLTSKQNSIRKLLAEKVTMELDAKQGYLTITTSFPEPLLSAQVADQACKLLQKYIIQFKIQKTTSKLAFIEERYIEKKKDFEKAQQDLARYRDQNRNVSSMVARTEEDRLQGEYTVALNVYNELAKQLEQSRIQVKEETPTFSVVQPALVPIRKSSPKTSMMLVGFAFLGALGSASWVLGKDHLKTLEDKWKEIQ